MDCFDRCYFRALHKLVGSDGELKWRIVKEFDLTGSFSFWQFPLPRVLYAMANDGIIYKFMKRVHPKTQTPLIATILSGFLAAIMATIFDLHQLIDMMSIGTLLAYTIVAICVLVLHYDAPQAIDSIKSPSMNNVIRQITNFKYTKQPSALSSNITKVGVAVFCVLTMILCTLMLFEFNFGNLVAIAVVVAGIALTIWIIARQPKDDSVELSFKVPLVPLLPCLSIFMNLYLMFQLDMNTWIRFIVWLIIGKLDSPNFLKETSTASSLHRLHHLLHLWHP
jgi:amino acid transporter